MPKRLEEYTVSELRKKAKASGVKNYSHLKKAGLIKCLRSKKSQCRRRKGSKKRSSRKRSSRKRSSRKRSSPKRRRRSPKYLQLAKGGPCRQGYKLGGAGNKYCLPTQELIEAGKAIDCKIHGRDKNACANSPYCRYNKRYGCGAKPGVRQGYQDYYSSPSPVRNVSFRSPIESLISPREEEQGVVSGLYNFLFG